MALDGLSWSSADSHPREALSRQLLRWIVTLRKAMVVWRWCWLLRTMLIWPMSMQGVHFVLTLEVLAGALRRRFFKEKLVTPMPLKNWCVGYSVDRLRSARSVVPEAQL